MLIRRRTAHAVFAALLLSLIVQFVPMLDAAETSRLPRAADPTLEEDIVNIQFSPDGRAVVFTKYRSKSSQVTNNFFDRRTRGDVWLQDKPGEPARNLTNGESDESGWWSPSWSPDSQRLLMHSSRGGHVGLWCWERETNQLRQLAMANPHFPDHHIAGAVRWLDNRRFLSIMLPEGERARPMTADGKAYEAAIAVWGQALKGEFTGQVVDSLSYPFPQRRLMVTDTTDGTSQFVAATSLTSVTLTPELNMMFWDSPSRDVVAVVASKGIYEYSTFFRAAMGFPASVELWRLNGTPLPLTSPLPNNVLTSTLRWSPDGDELAFFAFGDAKMSPLYLWGEAAREIQYDHVASLENPARLWRVNVRSGRVEKLTLGDISIDLDLAARFDVQIFATRLLPPQFMWTSTGELLFKAKRRSSLESRPEWLVLSRHAEVRSLTAAAQNVPATLTPISGGSSFVGIAAGDIWRIDPVTGNLANLTERLEPEIIAIDFLSDSQLTPRVVATDVKGTQHVVDLQTGHAVSLTKPRASATLSAFAGGAMAGAYMTSGREGTAVWRVPANGKAEQLMLTNIHRRNIILGKRQLIEFVTLNGRTEKAKLALPADYVPGRRYPMIVHTHFGLRFDRPRTDDESRSADSDDYYNSMGYVVLTPTLDRFMPGMEREGDSLNMLLNSVIPAVDKAIQLGVADPDRLFAYGASHGGYAVLGLITQTTRFKAGVADCAASSYVTNDGGLTEFMSQRYSGNPFDHAVGFELGAIYSTSNLPFWVDGRSARNQPLNYVDRVQTPILMFKNDYDGTMANAETFFVALMTQRKPAQLVRYLGDGHGQSIPANQRDELQRTFAWFDQWGDISRDSEGRFIWNGDRVKTRDNSPPLKPADYLAFDFFKSERALPSSMHATPTVPISPRR